MKYTCLTYIWYQKEKYRISRMLSFFLIAPRKREKESVGSRTEEDNLSEVKAIK